MFLRVQCFLKFESSYEFIALSMCFIRALKDIKYNHIVKLIMSDFPEPEVFGHFPVLISCTFGFQFKSI